MNSQHFGLGVIHSSMWTFEIYVLFKTKFLFWMQKSLYNYFVVNKIGVNICNGIVLTFLVVTLHGVVNMLNLQNVFFGKPTT